MIHYIIHFIISLADTDLLMGTTPHSRQSSGGYRYSKYFGQGYFDYVRCIECCGSSNLTVKVSVDAVVQTCADMDNTLLVDSALAALPVVAAMSLIEFDAQFAAGLV